MAMAFGTLAFDTWASATLYCLREGQGEAGPVHPLLQAQRDALSWLPSPVLVRPAPHIDVDPE